MRFSVLSVLVASMFTSGALAGYNCKCQDSNGQYNDLTSSCCAAQVKPFNDIHGLGPNHQCVSDANAIDSGAFVQCCKDAGVGGAYCWAK
ncbi:hypothetical protein PLICRDRAFT_50455 [Plicaturopsis crispa FD-325 SS-3]|nr:hypothetical protein PLICRDRAFT_50455 [Plicaturopsis crispa FD-325 SS-3]